MMRCCYCNIILNDENRTKEHVIPKSAGGASIGGKNIKPCCRNCNSWRGNKPLSQWSSEVLGYIKKDRDRTDYNRNDLYAILLNIELMKKYSNRILKIHSTQIRPSVPALSMSEIRRIAALIIDDTISN